MMQRARSPGVLALVSHRPRPHATRSRVTSLLLSFAVLVATASAALGATSSETGCETIVGDRDDLLSPADERGVGAAAARLASTSGAIVRVRLVRSAADVGELDTYADRLLDGCPAWRTPDGSARGTFLLLAVATDDRRTGTYYGDALVLALDPVREEVHAEMVPALTEERWGDALVVGLDGYNSILALNDDGSQLPVPERSGSPARPPVAGAIPEEVSAPATTVPVETSRPATSTAALLTWLGGLVALAGGALGISHRRRQREREAARATAMSVQATTSRAYYDLEDRWASFAGDRLVVAGMATEGDRAAVVMTQECDEADAALADLRTRVLDAPDAGEAEDLGAARRAEHAWTGLTDPLEAATREVSEAIAATDALREAAATAPGRIATVTDTVAEVSRVVVARQAEGFHASECAELLARAERILGDATVALDERRPGDAAAAAAAASGLAGRARDRAAGLPALRDGIPPRADAQRDRATALETRWTDEVATAHGELLRSYARSVWDDLAEAPTEVADRIGLVRLASETGVADASMDTQEFDRAVATLDANDRELAEVEGHLDAVVARLDDARQAEADLPAALHAAQEAGQRAVVFASDRRARLSRASTVALEAAERELETAVAEAATRPLDPVRALRAAHRSEETVARALAAATDQVRELEARITRARAACGDAERAITRATGMFDIWHADRLRDANATVATARSVLETDPDRAIGLAHEAERIADQVHAAKRRDRLGSGFSSGFASGSSSHQSFIGGGGAGSGSSGGGGSSGGSSGGFGGGGSSGW